MIINGDKESEQDSMKIMTVLPKSEWLIGMMEPVE